MPWRLLPRHLQPRLLRAPHLLLPCARRQQGLVLSWWLCQIAPLLTAHSGSCPSSPAHPDSSNHLYAVPAACQAACCGAKNCVAGTCQCPTECPGEGRSARLLVGTARCSVRRYLIKPTGAVFCMPSSPCWPHHRVAWNRLPPGPAGCAAVLCPTIYDPVCCCGRTFSNPCLVRYNHD